MIKIKMTQMALWTFLLLIPLVSFAQDSGIPQETDSSSAFVQDATHFAGVGFALLAVPFRFERQDWMRLGLAVGCTALLFSLDKNVKNFALRNQTSLNNDLFNWDSFQGNHYSLYLGLGFYGYGALAGNSKIRKMGLYATEAFIYSGTITGIFKVLISRRRPYAGANHLFFKPFQFTNNDYQALPSGHTTVSFAVSTALAKSLDNMYWKAFWYGTAGMVGASRIYHNKHWLSDVFLGAVIGYFTADFIVNSEIKRSDFSRNYSMQPILGWQNLGLKISF